jgi:lipoic acid synthetase
MNTMTTRARFPEWIKQSWASGDNVELTREMVELRGLHTVCQSARCPNMHECWSKKTATLMVLGNICTRNCKYCSVPSGKPLPPDADEPWHVAEVVRQMGLKHMVLTAVTRDDLDDDGAGHIARTVEYIHELNPGCTVEVLVPDFKARPACIGRVLDAEPEVFSHNIETVRRLYPTIRSKRYTYDLGLEVLRVARELRPRGILKSAFMVGHGETEAEVRETLEDLLDAGCDAVSIGQYLRPSKKQREVAEYVHPEQLRAYEKLAYELGFGFAVAGPFVRSSYRSEELLEAPFAKARLASRGRTD